MMRKSDKQALAVSSSLAALLFLGGCGAEEAATSTPAASAFQDTSESDQRVANAEARATEAEERAEEAEERVAELEAEAEAKAADEAADEEEPEIEAADEPAALDPEPNRDQSSMTMSQQNALGSARDYLEYTVFSRSGLIEQLEFEGYSTADATSPVDSLNTDYNAQAAKAAKDYLDYSSFSRSGLIEQLMFEGYTAEQATYGVDQTGL
ncbi:Ltp family lipoprotein [Kocuria sabuli]|uniref:Ltp family lipoprotein n=1 Tax=Kocuria sabuli TaxID=3071448 RepID=UPI0034D3C946